jgi:hypothetical protein
MMKGEDTGESRKGPLEGEELLPADVDEETIKNWEK